MRTIVCLAVGALFTLVTFLAPSAVMAAQKIAPGQEIPAFTLKALNPDTAGSPYVKTASYVGAQASTKATVISFFATYCEPCKKEMPFLAALQDAYGEAGLQVLLVSIDTDPDEIEKARSLAKANRLNFPVLSDRFNIVAKRYQVDELPRVYTTDHAGLIQTVHTGYGKDAGQVLLDDVRTIMGVSPDAPLPSALNSFFAPPVVEEPKAAVKPKVRTKKKKNKQRKRRKKK